MICIASTNFAKTLDWKREFNVAVWRHKQRTPSNNDHHTPLHFTLSFKCGNKFISPNFLCTAEHLRCGRITYVNRKSWKLFHFSLW